jgi:hypothetical protein
METQFLSKIEISTIMCLRQTTISALDAYRNDEQVQMWEIEHAFSDLKVPAIVPQIDNETLLAYLNFSLDISERCSFLAEKYDMLDHNLSFHILKYVTEIFVQIDSLKQKLELS